MSREEKVRWLSQSTSDEQLPAFLEGFRLPDEQMQSKLESFCENTLSNFHLPWGIVPNVMIDGTVFHVPVVTEESSVIAAASKAASFWAQRGGFTTAFTSNIKCGQIHFLFHGEREALRRNWDAIATRLRKSVKPLLENMEKRGGGIVTLDLKKVAGMPEMYHQVLVEIKTADSMGANIINSVLEQMAETLPDLVKKLAGKGKVDVIMAILSNYTPDSLVNIRVKAPVSSLDWNSSMPPEIFAQRMKLACDIAQNDRGRAATHNKGIFNGIDAVALATGNDFRAIEAGGHSFAVKNGKYKGLSRITLEEGIFCMDLEIALSLGTVGGLTRLHPLADKSLQILGNPNARSLMKIAAAVGLASNFAALASLVTTGIQQGHMKMHLKNILHSLNVNEVYHKPVLEFFQDKTVSMAAVKDYVATLE